jgi:hypothetical protein
VGDLLRPSDRPGLGVVGLPPEDPC